MCPTCQPLNFTSTDEVMFSVWPVCLSKHLHAGRLEGPVSHEDASEV